MTCCGWFKASSLLIVSSLLIGCGGGGPELPDIGTVEGVVTMDGTPLPNVAVGFQPEAGGRGSIGKTDDQGHYVLSYDADNKGAIVGTHKVSVTTPTEAPDPSGEANEPIPAKYNSKTEISKDVAAGDNTIDIDLSSN